MGHPAFSDAISAASQELFIEHAVTQRQIEAAQRLRYRVYCEERGYEPGENGRETDSYDQNARHILVRSRFTGATLGTVRVVLPKAATGLDSFPMNRVCEPYVLGPLPLQATGEISRFALTRDRAGVSPAAAALMRLTLMRGIMQVSAHANLTHWCAIMESSLLRLLRATAIHFVAVGPQVEYHGTRQPAIAVIDSVMRRIQREQPAVWSYVTCNGAFWTDRALVEENVSAG